MLYANDQRLTVLAQTKYYSLFVLGFLLVSLSAVLAGVHGVGVGRAFATKPEIVASGTFWAAMLLAFAIGFWASCLQIWTRELSMRLKLGAYSVQVSMSFICLYFQLFAVLLAGFSGSCLYFLYTGQLL